MRRAVIFLAVLAGLGPVGFGRAETPSLASATVVVYNRQSGDGASLAKFYAQQRGIPNDHIVGLMCSVQEEISREEYDNDIATPLRKEFIEHGWWTVQETPEKKSLVASSSIHFVALIKGMPLKIRGSINPHPGDVPSGGPIFTHNEACVDSELATLPFFSGQISGIIPNPYAESFRRIFEFEGVAPLLVARLDGPSSAIVRRMITDAIATEKTGLWGRSYVDGSRNTGGLAMGDKWMADIAQQMHKVGVPVVYDDQPNVFPDGYPITDCSIYYGWYSGGIVGPFSAPTFQFLPGSIAVHIHSFSANTVRDVQSNWVGPLLYHGATCTVGNVYEPYLQLTNHLDTLNDRLMRGMTFAEAAYISLPGISWMSTILGDPLYRPFSVWQQSGGSTSGDYRSYHEFAVKNKNKPAAEYFQSARQTASRIRNATMLEDLGSIQARSGNFQNAVTLYQQARAAYGKRDDILRVVLEEADTWTKLGKTRKGADLAKGVLRVVSADAPALPLLRRVAAGLPPIPTPTPTPH